MYLSAIVNHLFIGPFSVKLIPAENQVFVTANRFLKQINSVLSTLNMHFLKEMRIWEKKL